MVGVIDSFLWALLRGETNLWWPSVLMSVVITAFLCGSGVWFIRRMEKVVCGYSKGVAQAFRRPGSSDQSMIFKLRGLEPKGRYEIENFDGGKEVRTGRGLMRQGLTVTLKEKPAAAVIIYRHLSPAGKSVE